VPLSYVQFFADRVIAAPAESRRTPGVQTSITSARKAITDLARAVHALKASGDQRAFNAALVSQYRTWDGARRLLQLAGEELQHHVERLRRSSAATVSRIDTAREGYVRSSTNIQREYGIFQRQARLGVAFARLAAERFE
jgi:hypothetical protein